MKITVMKLKHLLYFIAITPAVTFAQVNLHTIGGTTTAGYTGDGSASIYAKLDSPSRTRLDAEGNVYFIQRKNHVVRKISTAGNITTVAGNDTAGYNGDNILAINARLNDPADILLDKLGNLYIVDKGNHRVRRVDKFTGLIETVAGDGQNINTGDGGPALSASLEEPAAITIDKYDTMYVACGNYIRKFVVGGDINVDYWTSHKVKSMCFDSTGNMYYENNNIIMKEDLTNVLTSTGGTSTIGNVIIEGMGANQADIEISDFTVANDGTIYVASMTNNRIYRIDTGNTFGNIYTIAGGGSSTSENVAPLTASTLAPAGIGLDTCGNVYFAEAGRHRMRMLTYEDCSPLSVANIQPLSYALYPNPATTLLVVEAATPVKDITILNSTGQAVLSVKANTNKTEVNISALARGLYFVKVTDKHGAQKTEKLTVQ